MRIIYSSQVLFAFVISAGLTVILSILYLLVQPTATAEERNPIDGYITAKICLRLQRLVGLDRPRRIAECLDVVVLSLSDQHLVFGIAILVAALKMLRERSISVYHFSIAVDLAWFSSGVHLASLVVIGRCISYRRAELQSFPIAQRSRDGFPFVEVWRAFCVVVLASLLITALTVPGCRTWYSNFNCPAHCASFNGVGDVRERWMIALVCSILISYPYYLINIFETSKDRQIRVLNKIEKVDRSIVESVKFTLVEVMYACLRIPLRCLWYLYTSDFWIAAEAIAWFSFGLWSVIRDRSTARGLMSPEEIVKEGTTTGFGQLVPLIMLMLPLMTLTEAIQGKALPRRRHCLPSIDY